MGRFALIIANSKYFDPALRNLIAPTYDASGLARVLADRDIGSFSVTTLLDQPAHLLKRKIGIFFDNRKGDDLLLVYFSGHGIKDSDGDLYFGTLDTEIERLHSTSLDAQFLKHEMSHCLSRRQILLLDCCYSGAFQRGMLARANTKVDLADHLLNDKDGLPTSGRIVLTASEAMQYAFEGQTVTGKDVRSIFTEALIEGLQTGDADLDGDGFFSILDIYEYLRRRISEVQPYQHPMLIGSFQGKVIVGRNPKRLVTTGNTAKASELQLPTSQGGWRRWTRSR